MGTWFTGFRDSVVIFSPITPNVNFVDTYICTCFWNIRMLYNNIELNSLFTRLLVALYINRNISPSVCPSGFHNFFHRFCKYFTKVFTSMGWSVMIKTQVFQAKFKVTNGVQTSASCMLGTNRQTVVLVSALKPYHASADFKYTWL